MYAWGGSLVIEDSRFINNNVTAAERAALVVASGTQAIFAGSSFTQSTGSEILLQEVSSLLYSDWNPRVLKVNPESAGTVLPLDRVPPSAKFLNQSDPTLVAIREVRAFVALRFKCINCAMLRCAALRCAACLA